MALVAITTTAAVTTTAVAAANSAINKKGCGINRSPFYISL